MSAICHHGDPCLCADEPDTYTTEGASTMTPNPFLADHGRGWLPGTRYVELDCVTDTTTDERRPYFTGPMADPEALGAVCAYVQREYGLTGYHIGIEGMGRFVCCIVRHSDGSEFRLLADRWGNVENVQEDTTQAILDAVGRLAARS